MAQLLLSRNCTVTIAHSRTRDLAAVAARADVLVAAVGRPEMVKGDWVKPGAIVIDVGVNRIAAPERGEGKTRLVGDVAFAEASYTSRRDHARPRRRRADDDRHADVERADGGEARQFGGPETIKGAPRHISRRRLFSAQLASLPIGSQIGDSRGQGVRIGLLAAIVVLASSPALAEPECGNNAQGFDQWLPYMEREAMSAGIRPDVVQSSLANAAYDPDVVSHDRRQGSFQTDVATFAAKRVTNYRVKKGKQMMIAYGEPLQSIEQRYRRAAADPGRDLGARVGVRGGVWHLPDLQRAGDARLRLPALRRVP